MIFYRLRLTLVLLQFVMGLVMWPIGVVTLVRVISDGSWFSPLLINLIAPFTLFFSARDFERLQSEKRNHDEFMNGAPK